MGLISKGRLFSDQDLQEKINSFAYALFHLGIKKGDKVGILLRNSAEFLITYFATTKIGAVVVPINFLLKPEEISSILRDSGTVILVFEELLSTPKLQRINEVTAADFGVNQNGSHLASIIYTSGTLGKPKGVMLTHKNFLANVFSCQQVIELKENDHLLCLLPMFHSFAWTVGVLLPLLKGLTTVIVESVHPFTRVMQAIHKYKVTIFVAVPPVYVALDRLPSFLRFFSPLRLCVFRCRCFTSRSFN